MCCENHHQVLSLHINGFLCQFSSFKCSAEQKQGGDERRAKQLELEEVGGQLEERVKERRAGSEELLHL